MIEVETIEGYVIDYRDKNKEKKFTIKTYRKTDKDVLPTDATISTGGVVGAVPTSIKSLGDWSSQFRNKYLPTRLHGKPYAERDLINFSEALQKLHVVSIIDAEKDYMTNAEYLLGEEKKKTTELSIKVHNYEKVIKAQNEEIMHLKNDKMRLETINSTFKDVPATINSEPVKKPVAKLTLKKDEVNEPVSTDKGN